MKNVMKNVMKNSILLTDIIERIKGIPSTDINGDVVMMHVEKGKYFGLDSVGSRIWELIAGPQVVKDIILVLLEEYEVEESTCQEQVLEFVNLLHREGLIIRTRENVG